MTPKRLLELNGDFPNSSLVETARRLHAAFSKAGVDYAIVGGLAVARNGAVRTTQDIDVLTERAGWPKVVREAGDRFTFGVDSAVDRESGVAVEFLFSGETGLPRQAEVGELDSELGARFATLARLLELKCAVYLSKKSHEGIELAAKDLGDVVALLQANRGRIDEALLGSTHPAVRDELGRIWAKVR